MTTPNTDPSIEDQEKAKKRELLKKVAKWTVLIIVLLLLWLLAKGWYYSRDAAGSIVGNSSGAEQIQDTTKPSNSSDTVKVVPKKITNNAQVTDFTNVRSLPNQSIVWQFEKGTRIEAIGISADGNWIETPRGWIAKNLVTNCPGGLPLSDKTHSAPAGWTKKEGGKDDPGSTSSVQSHGDQ